GSSWVSLEHDRNGNTTVMPQPNEPTEGFAATYDAWNRLVRLEGSPVPDESASSSSSLNSSSSSSNSEAPLVIEYAYDGLNWRITKNSSEEVRNFGSSESSVRRG